MWPGESLLYVLRERLGLPGAKNACEQGECGSCTVYLDGAPVCACLVAAGQAAGPRRWSPSRGCADRTTGLRPGAGGLPRRRGGAVRILHAGADRGRARPARPRPARRPTRRSARRWPATCAGAPATRRSWTRCGWPRPDGDRVIVIEGCAIATVDAAGTEHADGHVVVGDDGRIAAVGAGPLRRADDRRCAGSTAPAAWSPRAWSTPTTTSTSGPPAGWPSRTTLFDWLTALYPVWARHRRRGRRRRDRGRARLAGAVRLHHDHRPPLRLPARRRRPVRRRRSRRPREIGLRFHPCRGSMDLGASRRRPAAGLASSRTPTPRSPPPRRRSTATTTRRPDSMVRVAVAPCSPFSVTPKLMTRGRGAGPRARACGCTPTWPRPLDEEEFCRATHGCTPVEYAERLGWLGDDVWLAHGVHLDDAAVARLGATGTGVAHCPSSNARLGAGIARVRDLLDAGVPVGLGRRRRRRRRRPASSAPELRQALLRGPAAGRPGRADRPGGARAGHHRRRPLPGPATTRSARWRSASSADLALWRLDGLGHAGIDDPVAALVFGPPAPLELLLVGGRPVVERGELRTADAERAGPRRARRAHRTADREGAMTATPRPSRPRSPAASGSSPAPAGRHAEGEGRVRVLLRPVGRRHALGRDAAQPAPAGPHPSASTSPARWPCPGVYAVLTPEDVPGAQALRPGARRPAGARHRRGALPGRAGRDRGRRPPGDRPPGGRPRSRSTTRCCRRSPTPRRRCGRTRRGAPGRGNRAAARADPPAATRDGRSRRRRGHRRVRGRHAGPGVPRPGVRARRAGRGRRRRPLRRHPVAARRPAAGRRLPRACPRRRCG